MNRTYVIISLELRITSQRLALHIKIIKTLGFQKFARDGLVDISYTITYLNEKKYFVARK